ncbi:MAG TPA: adenylate/guanylate cyclase domain-containing protein [Solirubrobacteraceae bacterium]|nr:adenylate/guanylate cyclase domain-containing protein [Solirubrobacteraceae bacterium]
MTSGPPEPPSPRSRKLAEALRRADGSPLLMRAVNAAREVLPGDPRFGDELSTAAGRPAELVARHLTEMREARPSAVREVGLTALQLWQAVSEKAGRGHGHEGAAILFTDLVGFSSWVLEVGDEAALDLLRAVSGVVEPAIREHDGRLVKRLGDGHMAVFGTADDAVAAALDMLDRLEGVEVCGHRPQLRTGIHVGHPRRLGGDYLGADVNIAARVMDAAKGGELLVSEAVVDRADCSAFELKKRRWFRAKGTPRELQVYSLQRAG